MMHNNLDNQFKSKLGTRIIEPSSDRWSEIERQLGDTQPQNHNHKKVLLFSWLGGIAAVLIVAIAFVKLLPSVEVNNQTGRHLTVLGDTQNKTSNINANIEPSYQVESEKPMVIDPKNSHIVNSNFTYDLTSNQKNRSGKHMVEPQQVNQIPSLSENTIVINDEPSILPSPVKSEIAQNDVTITDTIFHFSFQKIRLQPVRIKFKNNVNAKALIATVLQKQSFLQRAITAAEDNARPIIAAISDRNYEKESETFEK